MAEREAARPRGWNWGAFLLGWLWAFAHRVWVPGILGLVPGLNFAMMPVFGLKGNEWAWRNRKWSSVSEFQQSERSWARTGAAIWVVGGSAIALRFLT